MPGSEGQTFTVEVSRSSEGAILSLSGHYIYPFYTICGRVLDMTALNDQHYGGLIIWLPGTLTTGATWGGGQYGSALRLDGVNDYVSLGNPTALRLTGSVTITAWIVQKAAALTCS